MGDPGAASPLWSSLSVSVDVVMSEVDGVTLEDVDSDKVACRSKSLARSCILLLFSLSSRVDIGSIAIPRLEWNGMMDSNKQDGDERCSWLDSTSKVRGKGAKFSPPLMMLPLSEWQQPDSRVQRFCLNKCGQMFSVSACLWSNRPLALARSLCGNCCTRELSHVGVYLSRASNH